MRVLSRHEILDYEIRSSWWASWCPLHGLAAAYFAWKVKRKHARYVVAIERENYLRGKGLS